MFRTNQANQATVAELHDLRERLLVCERQLAEHHGSERLCPALSALMQKFVRRETLHVEIVRWPPHFARQLLLAGVKCDATIREAVRIHTELLRDIVRAQELLDLASRYDNAPLLHRKAHDSALALRRQLHYRRQNLHDLGVTLSEVAKGDRFNPMIHEPVGTEPAGPELQDTIAEAKMPLYSWTDEQGLQQHVPAQVIVYSVNGRRAAST